MKKIFVLIFFIFFISLFLSINLSFSKKEIKETNENPKISPEIYKHLEKFKNKNNENNNIQIPVIIKFKKNQKIKNDELKFKPRILKINEKKFIATNITFNEFNKLKENPNIEAIYYDPKLKVFLDTSTKLLGSDSFWNLTINGESINGSTEAVCVIDTGIDFSHSAFGNCSISYFDENGDNVSYFLESPHPYPDNSYIKYKINYTNFSKIAIHFSNISVEEDWDYIKILDANNFTIATYTGNHNDLWSPSINGDTLYIVIESDELYNDYGFFIDEIKNGTTNNTINWSCEKIISGWDFVNDDGIPYDDHGHGTHVSGIIASIDPNYPGVAKGSKLISVKSMDYNGDGSASDVAAGINYCVENKEKYNISVISMSLGDGTYSDYCDDYLEWFSEIVQKAIDKNISVVIAAGNNGNSNGIAFPSCLKNVTSVGSVDKSKAISSYSQSSLILDLLAYGTNIISSKLNGGFISSSGTSMATPHVSGSILLINHFKKKENSTLLNNNLTYTPYQIETILKNTGILINDSRNNLTFPLVNLSKALKEINSLPQIIFYQQDINNSNISRNYSYLEFSFSEQVFNITLIYDKLNISITDPYTNISYNITNLTQGFHNYSIIAYDILKNSVQSGTFYIYVDTIKPKSVIDLNATLLEDGSVFLIWSKVSNDINNNSERAVLYNIYRKLENETNLIINETSQIIKIENYNEVINYTDSNITTNNYTYFVLTSDASGNFNNSITEKNSINLSVFCNTSFSDWSSFSSCINGIQTRQRQRTCFGKTEIETENQSCVVKKSSNSGSSSRGYTSSSVTNNLPIKTYYIKEGKINLTGIIKQIKFSKEKLQLKYEEIKNISIEKNNTYIYFNISVNDSVSAEIIFSVKKTWLFEKNISPYEISLFKYNIYNKNWQELSTDLIANLTNEFLYSSFTNNFSIFAISQKQKEISNRDIENKSNTEKSITNKDITNEDVKNKENPILKINEPKINETLEFDELNKEDIKINYKFLIISLIGLSFILVLSLFYILIYILKKDYKKLESKKLESRETESIKKEDINENIKRTIKTKNSKK